MARPSILEAVERKRAAEVPPRNAAPQPAKAAPPVERKAQPQALPVSRAGKVNVSAYFPPEVKASLRLVQAKRGGKVQDLLAEAHCSIFFLPNTTCRRLRRRPRRASRCQGPRVSGQRGHLSALGTCPRQGALTLAKGPIRRTIQVPRSRPVTMVSAIERLLRPVSTL